MPRPTLLLIFALAGCSEAADRPAAADRRTASVVGLYERAGVPDRPSQICVSADEEQLRFGLRSSYEGPENCMMKGRVEQAGSALRLRIDGDPACSVSGTITATGLTLAQPQGAECSYYCGRNTDLDGGDFAKVGGTEADARKAVDIAGEPLCT